MSETSDLEKRLRREADSVLGKPLCDGGHLFREAAERISELEAEVSRLTQRKEYWKDKATCYRDDAGVLVGRWRTKIVYSSDEDRTFHECADELEALLNKGGA